MSVGGTVSADAGSSGTLLDYGSINVSNTSTGGTGGSVELLGEWPPSASAAQPRVDASGDIGGARDSDRRRSTTVPENAAVRDAAKTYIGSTVTLSADAITQGNGGKVVVWSNEATWFYGSLTARGGMAGGNGGSAEISSGGGLAESGQVDLSAPHGQTGLLLLDPDTIQIVTSGGNGNGDLPTVQFADTPNNMTILDSAIVAANANIDLQANKSITTSGAPSTSC